MMVLPIRSERMIKMIVETLRFIMSAKVIFNIDKSSMNGLSMPNDLPKESHERNETPDESDETSEPKTTPIRINKRLYQKYFLMIRSSPIFFCVPHLRDKRFYIGL